MQSVNTEKPTVNTKTHPKWKHNILVIEDEPEVRDSYVDMFDFWVTKSM